MAVKSIFILAVLMGACLLFSDVAVARMISNEEKTAESVDGTAFRRYCCGKDSNGNCNDWCYYNKAQIGNNNLRNSDLQFKSTKRRLGLEIAAEERRDKGKRNFLFHTNKILHRQLYMGAVTVG